MTPLEQFSDTYIGEDPIWEQKPINKLLWRGSTTGAEFMKGTNWESSQRARLHLKSHLTQGRVSVLVKDEVKPRELKSLNQRLMDTSFSGGPVQCDPTTCEYMKTHLNFAKTMGLEDSYQVGFVFFFLEYPLFFLSCLLFSFFSSWVPIEKFHLREN